MGPPRIDDNPGAFSFVTEPLGSAVPPGMGESGTDFAPRANSNSVGPFVAGSVPGQMSLSFV